MAIAKPVTNVGLEFVLVTTNRIIEYILFWRSTNSLTDAVTDEELKYLEISEGFTGTDVTTSHYIPKNERTQCQKPDCGITFLQYPGFRRPHHCRRCGEIFCRNCLRNKRRLNIMAQPDPLGVLCKVCPGCYGDRGLDLGCTKRSLTKEFLEMREKARAEMEVVKLHLTIESRPTATEPVFWKAQVHVDILKECLRLLRGFEQHTDNFEALNQIYQLQKYVKTPSWQKSTFWKLDSRRQVCRECNKRQESRREMRNCKVCGLALCKMCAHKVLLLYFEDGIRPGRDTPAKLAIIRLKGSPEREPKYSILLHCCTECKEEISKLQIENEDWYINKPPPPDFDSQFARYDDEFRKLTDDISNNIERLSQAILDKEERDAERESFVVIEPEQHEEQDTLGYLQEELTKQIQFYWNQYTKLKSLVDSNNEKVRGSVSTLTRKYMQARSEFYIETKSRISRTLSRMSQSPVTSSAQ